MNRPVFTSSSTSSPLQNEALIPGFRPTRVSLATLHASAIGDLAHHILGDTFMTHSRARVPRRTSIIARALATCLALVLALAGPTSMPAAAATSASIKGTGQGESKPFTLSAGVYQLDFSYSGNATRAPFSSMLMHQGGDLTTELLEATSTKESTRRIFNLEKSETFHVYVHADDGVSWKGSVKKLKSPAAKPGASLSGTGLDDSALFTLNKGTYKISTSYSKNYNANGVYPFYLYMLCADGGGLMVMDDHDTSGSAADKISISQPVSCWFSSDSAPEAKWKVKIEKHLSSAPTPKISGSAKVGTTLTAKAGTWKPSSVKLSYQWQRNGKDIKGATKSKYKLTKSDKGKKITVKVTGKKSGYKTTSKTSKASSKVK